MLSYVHIQFVGDHWKPALIGADVGLKGNGDDAVCKHVSGLVTSPISDVIISRDGLVEYKLLLWFIY